MNIEFTPEDHKYYVDGQEFPNMTGVIADMGLSDSHVWAQDSDRDRGSAVALGVQYINTGVYEEASTHEALVGYLRGYKKFLEQSGFKYLDGEVAIASPTLKIAGRPDCWGTVEQELWLVDCKSGQWPKHSAVGVQLAGYGYILAETHGLKFAKRKAVRLSNDGDYKVRDYSDPVWTKYFLDMVGLWRLKKSNGLNGASR